MGLSIVFAGLKKSVSKFTAEYEAGRSRQPELAPYATTASLLDALKLSSPLTDDARDAVVLALITEQQRAPHPLWQSLLLAAFEPMLRRLCGRLGGGKTQVEENEQRVLMAFLEAAQEISLIHPPERAALHLRRATENTVFRGLRSDRREAAHAAFEEESHPCDPHAMSEQAVALATKEIAALVAKEENGEEILKALIATHGGDESLKQYVGRTQPELAGTERKRVYKRLQQQVLRTTKRLRTRLRVTSDSPTSSP